MGVSRISGTLGIGLLTATLLHALMSLTPSVQSWGIDYWSEIPFSATCVLVILVVLAVVPRVAGTLDLAIGQLVSSPYSPRVGVLIATALFILFSSSAYSYGDGYSFQALLSSDRIPELSGNLLFMPGDILVHWMLHHFVVGPIGFGVNATYAVVSVLAGLLALFACVRIAKAVFPNQERARWFLIASACASGSAAIWFGHVEAYSLTMAALLWSIVFAVESSTSGRSIVWAWVLWLVAVLMHLLALSLFPLLLWRTITSLREVPTRMWPRVRAVSVLVVGFLLCAVGAAIFGVITPGILVPLLATTESEYWSLSSAHLIDVLNLTFFCAPIGLLGVVAWFTGRSKPSNDSPEGDASAAGIEVLSVAAFSLWLFAFWVDPLIGGFRDWDLLGAFGIPLSLWGAAVLVNRGGPASSVPRNWIAVALFAVAHAGTFVWAAQYEEKSALRVDRMVLEDLHYSERFHKGERRVSWADLLSRQLGRDDLAKVHNQARVTYEPNDSQAWRNLAMNYWKLGQSDSAVVAQRRSAEINGSKSVRWQELAQLCMKVGNLACVRDAYEKYLSVVDTSYTDRNVLASVYIDLGADSLAIPLLERSVSQQQERFEAYYLLGIIAERSGDSIAALSSYQEAIRRGGTLADLQVRLSQLSSPQGRSLIRHD